MTDKILVQSGNGRAFWERDDAHPGGEVFVGSSGTAEAAKTPAVNHALHNGRLVEVEAPKKAAAKAKAEAEAKAKAEAEAEAQK